MLPSGFLSPSPSHLTGGDIALSSLSCEKLQALHSVYAVCSHARQFQSPPTNGQGIAAGFPDVAHRIQNITPSRQLIPIQHYFS